MLYERKELIGKLFFGIGILVLLSMFVSPISNIFIHVDEYWTYSLINLPLMDGMRVAVHDVHPPLYYLMLYFLSPLIGSTNLYLLKIVSIIPYALIILVSATKIREDYDWFTAGLFVFSIGVMSDFFVEFLTIRMYSWGLFFVVMSYIYYKDVVTKWDRKSWVLLTVCTLCSAYLHYFFAITCGLIYLLILYEIWTQHKDKLKQFGKSVAALVILYAPWGIIFIRQLKNTAAGSHETFHLDYIIHYLTYFAIKSEDFRLEMLIFKLLAFAFLIFVLVLIYKKKDNFSASGMLLVYGTIFVGIVLLMFSFNNTMRVRYLVPALGVFWLAASVAIGKIENKRIFMIALILIFILAFAGLSITSEDMNSRIKFYDEKAAFLDSINNNSTIIYYNTDYGYKILHNDLNNTKQYSVSDTYFYDDDIEVSGNLTKILDENPDKNVYLVNWRSASDRNAKYEQNYTLVEKYDGNHYLFYLVSK